MLMPSIRQLCVAACLVAGFFLAACDSPQRQMDFDKFLSENSPALKVQRDQIVATIADIKARRKELKVARSKYRSEAARTKMDYFIQQVDAELQQTEMDLKALDEKIELAMVEKDRNHADAGGLRTKESEELASLAHDALKKANELRQLMENDGEEKPTRTNVRKPSLATDPDSRSDSNPSLPRDASDKSPTGPAPAVTETSTKPKTGELPKPDPRKTQSPGPKPTAKPAPPPIDREAIQKEIRRLDAAIATTEANLNAAWDRVKAISHNHTVPVVRGSRQHQEIQLLERVIQNCETQLPGLKDRRDQLKAKLEDK
jgi:hypothetical protein